MDHVTGVMFGVSGHTREAWINYHSLSAHRVQRSTGGLNI